MPSLLYSLDTLKKFQKNNCIIWRESSSKELIISYYDVIQAADKFLIALKELEVIDYSRILVNIGHSLAVLPVILSVLNKPCCYCPVSVTEDNVEECLYQYETGYLICDKKFSSAFPKPPKAVNILGIDVQIYTVKRDVTPVRLYNDILCYSIKTSGSTGEPKVVNVPYSCIVPNISSLSHLFSVQATDVLFISSPPTFDPFIVDIFIALLNGAAILLVPTALRLVPNILAPLIFQSDSPTATICQMTPSLFRLFRVETLKDNVFFEGTTLRILVLGGEPFPSSEEFHQWPIWQLRQCIRLFTIYGITEVSCWSSINEITRNDEEIALGQPLDESTTLVVRAVSNHNEVIENGCGELFIESNKRKCFIHPESPDILTTDQILSRKTGDFVEKRDGKIFYKSRTDSIVKRFGCKINLKTIEDKIKCLDSSVRDIHCVYDSKQNLLLAFIRLCESYTETASIYKGFESFLKSEIPDAVIIIEKFPLSCHGKISKQKLMKYYKSTRGDTALGSISTTSNFMRTKLKEYLNLDIDNIDESSNSKQEKRFRLQSWDEKSFLDIGGTSFIALRILTDLEDAMCQSLGNIFVKLLDPNYPLKEIFADLKDYAQSTPKIRSDLNFEENDSKLKLDIVWKYNLHKCIDSSPTVIKIPNGKSIVAVGSHSHKLTVLDADTGSEISTLELPDRIESQISFWGEHGIVGCYDGFLYKFVVETGEISQKYDSGGMIKCRPLIVEDFVLFGNYSESENVFCLELNSFKKRWARKISSKSVFASPVLYDKDYFVVCTLDGLIACLNYRIGSTKWEMKFKTPIFSTPIVFLSNKLAIAEVGGNIHCIEKAEQICSYHLPASVFSSVRVIGESTLVFGCYDHKIYFLKYENEKKGLYLLWNIQLEAQIYSTPAMMVFNSEIYIVACTTNGKIHLIDLKERKAAACVNVGGEIFSSPAVDNKKVFVGCRNNYLYCIELNYLRK